MRFKARRRTPLVSPHESPWSCGFFIYFRPAKQHPTVRVKLVKYPGVFGRFSFLTVVTTYASAVVPYIFFGGAAWWGNTCTNKVLSASPAWGVGVRTLLVVSYMLNLFRSVSTVTSTRVAWFPRAWEYPPRLCNLNSELYPPFLPP